MVRPIPIGSAVFDTAVGPCRIAWTERGVCLLRLPTPALQRERERRGALGGFSAFGGAALKRTLLAIEGVTIEPHPARRSGERRRVRLDENLSLFGEEPAR